MNTPRLSITLALTLSLLTLAGAMLLLGLLGLVAYLAIMAVFFWQGLRGLGHMADEGLRSILVGLLAAVLSALVAGVLDHHFLDINFPHVAALFWLNVGLGIATLRVTGNQGIGDQGIRLPAES